MPDQDKNFRTLVKNIYSHYKYDATDEQLDSLEKKYAGKEGEAVKNIYSHYGYDISDDELSATAEKYNFKKKVETGSEEQSAISKDSISSSESISEKPKTFEEISASPEFQKLKEDLKIPEAKQSSTSIEKPVIQENYEGELRVKEDIAPVERADEFNKRIREESLARTRQEIIDKTSEIEKRRKETKPRETTFVPLAGGSPVPSSSKERPIRPSERAEFEKPNIEAITDQILESKVELEKRDVTTGFGRGFTSFVRDFGLGEATKYLSPREKAELVVSLKSKGYFDQFGEVDEDWLATVGEVLGSQTIPIIAAMIPGVGIAATATLQSKVAESNAYSGYLDKALAEGMDIDQAMGAAHELSKTAKKGALIESLIGVVPVSKLLSSSKNLGKLLVHAGADALTDASVATVLQLVENKEARFHEIPVDYWNGVAENAGGEAIFSLVMNLVGIPGQMKKSIADRFKSGLATEADMDVLRRAEFDFNTGEANNALSEFNKDTTPGQGITFDVDNMHLSDLGDKTTGGDVLTIRSETVKGEVTPSMLAKFKNKHIDAIDEFSSGNVKIGVSTNPDQSTEIGLELTRPKSERESTVEAARVNNQRTIYSAEEGSIPVEKITPKPLPQSKLTTDEKNKISKMSAKLDNAIDDGRTKDAEDIILDINKIKREANKRPDKKIKKPEEQVQDFSQNAFEGKEGIQKLKGILSAKSDAEAAALEKARSERILKRNVLLERGMTKKVGKDSEGDAIYETKFDDGVFEVESEAGDVYTLDKRKSEEKWSAGDDAKQGENKWRVTDGGFAKGPESVVGTYNTKRDAAQAIKNLFTSYVKDVDGNNEADPSERNYEQKRRKIHEGAKRMMKDPEFKHIGEIIQNNLDEYTYFVQQTGKEFDDAMSLSLDELLGARELRTKEVRKDIWSKYGKESSKGVAQDAAIILKANKDGKYNLAAGVYNDALKLGEQAGRILQAMSLIKGSTPQGMADMIISGIENNPKAAKKAVEDGPSKKTKDPSGIKVGKIQLTPDQKAQVNKLTKDLFDTRDKARELSEKSQKRNLTPTEHEEQVKLKIDTDHVLAELSIQTSRWKSHSFAEKHTDYVRGALLGATSHVVNFSGNAINAMPRILGGMMRDALQNAIESGTGLSPAESISTGLKGFSRGGKRGVGEFMTGRFINQENKFDLGGRINSLRDWNDLFKDGLKSAMKNGFDNIDVRRGKDNNISLATKLETVGEMTFGFVPDITYRALRLGDQTFRSSAKLKEIFRQARKAEGRKIKNDQEAEAWFEQLKNDPNKREQYDNVKNVVKRAEDYAVFAHDTGSSFAASETLRGLRKVGDFLYGEEGTGRKIKYNDKFVDSVVTGVRKGIGNAVNLAISGTVPFVKVPTNIISMAKDIAVPIKPILNIYNAIDTKNLDNIDEDIGSLMSSGMTWGLYLAAKKAGSINLLTKDEERDPALRAIAYEKGSPNSLNWHRTMRYIWGDPDWDKDLRGDWTVSLVNTGPQGVAINMMAAIDRDLENKTVEDMNTVDHIFQSVKSTFTGVKNTAFGMSMLTGITTTLDAMGNPNGGTYGYNQLAKTIGSPLTPRLAEQVFTMPQRTIRISNRQLGFFDRLGADFYNSSVIAAFPGTKMMSDNSLAHLDIWGQEASLPHGEEGYSKFLASTTDALRSREIVADQMTLDIFDLMQKTKDFKIISWPSSQISIWVEGNKSPTQVNMSREMTDQMIRTIQPKKKASMRYEMEKPSFQNKTPEGKAESLREIDQGMNKEKARWEGMVQDRVTDGTFKIRLTQNDPKKYELVIPEL